MNQPLRWPAEAIWEQVAPLLPGFTVEVLPQIDSTNTELMRRARAGQNEPVLLVAEEQTAGRGRMGRDWQGERAASLLFSLGLPFEPREWSGLSLVVGMAVARALHAQLRLKWPNDLYWNSRKLGGILIETASTGSTRYAVIGIGINILERPAEGLRTPPAAVCELLPGVDAPEVLWRVALPLVQAVLQFSAQGFAPWQRAYQTLDLLHGQEVACSDGTLGTACGVDGSGALLVHTSAGLQKISSAEVSVRSTGSTPPAPTT